MDRILYQYALGFVGTPYIWGGNNPLTGMDCSGFVIEVLKAGGVLPRKYDATSQQLYDFLKPLSRELIEPQEGAILFFGDNNTTIRHVSLGLCHTKMIEAAGGDSSTKTIEDAKRQNAFIMINQIKYRSNLCGVLLPKWN